MRNENSGLADLYCEIIAAMQPLSAFADVAKTALTLNGKIEEDDAWQSLSFAERAVLLERLNAPPSRDEHKFYFCHKKYSRVYVVAEDKYCDFEDYKLLGFFYIDSKQYNNTINDISKHDVINSAMAEHVKSHYAAHGDFPRDLSDVLYTISHMSPVTFFIGFKVYTNLYNSGQKDQANREVDIAFALEQSASIELEDVSGDVLCLVFVLSCLNSIGQSLSFEEANYKQIDIKFLRDFITKKQRETDCFRENTDFGISKLKSISKELGRTIAKKKSSGLFYYRIINGITLSKVERAIHMSADEIYRSLSPTLHEGVSDYFSRQAIPHHNLEQAFRDLFQSKMNRPLQPRLFTTCAEEVINHLLDQATVVLRADFSMTRFVKNPFRFLEMDTAYDNTGDAGPITAMKPSEFMCQCVPSRKVANEMETVDLLRFLNAISARMRFNSWHYLAGNFPREAIADGRDYYFPPKAVDIATADHYLHAGHAACNINHSIKIPYPLFTPNNTYDGFLDFRVMRMRDEGFSVLDIQLSYAMVRTLSVLYQALTDFISTRKEPFEFSIGAKDWYKAAYAPRSQRNQNAR